jgi:hypothetical protein
MKKYIHQALSCDTSLGKQSGNHCRRDYTSWLNLRHLGFHGRRVGKSVNTYVDRYEAPLLAAALLIIVCSILDAAFTLELLRLGALELNYLMAHLIEQDLGKFIWFKVSLTGLSITFLVIHKNFRIIGRFTVTHLLYLIAMSYMLLVYYQILMFRHMAG